MDAILSPVTLIGNMTLILVLLCKRSRRKKRVNILLLNLAFGDLAVAMFVNSTEILFLAFGDWALGPIACKISVYVQMICLSSATNLLTTMSIDRYQVIVKPMQSLASRSWIWLKIFIAWTLSLLFPIPQLFIFVQYNSGLKFDGTPRRVCGSSGYTAPWQRKVYFTYTTVYILIIPMAIMLYCYVRIIQVVWIRARNETRRTSCLTPPRTLKTAHSLCTSAKSSASDGRKDDTNIECPCCCETNIKGDARATKNMKWARNLKGNKSPTNNHSCDNKTLRVHGTDDEDSNSGSPRMSVRRGLVSASKRRVLIMTLTVVLSFLVCHTPYFCITLVRIYSDYQLQLEMAIIVSEFMVMVHSTLNPILYGLFALREYHLKYVFTFLTCSSRSISQKSSRFGQYSDEKHELLTNVHSSLVCFSNNGRTKTIVAHNSYNTNIHVNPLTDRSEGAERNPQFVNPSIPSSEPLLPNSVLQIFRSKSMPQLRKQIKRKQKHKSDTILFVNIDAIQSMERNNQMADEQVAIGLSSTQSVIQFDSIWSSNIANSHAM